MKKALSDNKRRNITLALSILCPSFQSIFLAGLPILLPLIRKDLGFSFTQGGSLIVISSLIYGFMQVPAGYLADRFRPKLLVFGGTLGVTTLSLALGFITNYWQILVIQILFGFFNAFVLIPAMSIFIGWLPPHKRATANVLPIFGIGIGMMLINLFFPFIVSLLGTWRAPFIIFSIPGIISALFLLILGRDTPSKGPVLSFNLKEILNIFGFVEIWICFALQFIRFGIVQGLIFWLPSFLMGEKSFSIYLVGWLMAIHSVISSSSSILGGYLSDRSGKPAIIIGMSMILLGLTTGLLFLLNSTGLVIIIIIINAIFIQFYFGSLFAIPIEIFGKEKAGISNGMGNMFANMGALNSAFLMGLIRDITGSFEYGLYSICFTCLIGLILSIVLSRIKA